MAKFIIFIFKEKEGVIKIDLFNRLIKEEEGQGMVEYILIFSMIVIISVAILGALGTSLSNYYISITNKIIT